ncbi:hypothetical protein QCA50_007252 [Cerrena zonata]|uniref:Secreted protein n=1 Tax=Cerrena zonata TaxID=2478898 RepID=A0AAW0G7M0_9APHY
MKSSFSFGLLGLVTVYLDLVGVEILGTITDSTSPINTSGVLCILRHFPISHFWLHPEHRTFVQTRMLENVVFAFALGTIQHVLCANEAISGTCRASSHSSLELQFRPCMVYEN